MVNSKFKKVILVLSLATGFNLSAMEVVNCNKEEINKDFDYFCVVKKGENYYIKEAISLIDEEKEVKKGELYKNKELENSSNSLSFRTKIINPEKPSKQIYRIQEVKYINDEIFKHKIEVENQNGLITVIGDNNSLYTLRAGYIQKNGQYLEVRNNKLGSLDKENIEDVKKVSSNYEIYALNYNNELWNKKDELWKKVDIGLVYDFVYLEDGILYALTDKGLYENKPTFKKKGVGEKDLIIDNFILMDLKIDESLYLDKIKYNEYKNNISNLLFNKDSELGTHLTGMLGNELRPYFKNKYSDEYDIEINSGVINVVNSKNRGFDIATLHYRDTVKDNQLESYYYRGVNIDEQLIYSVESQTYLTTVLRGVIETKYNGSVVFENKEKVVLKNKNDNPVKNYEYRSDVINVKNKDGVYFSLRTNGMLTIFDTIKDKEHEVYNVNNVFLENNDIYILIDKNFESEIREMKALPIIDYSKITREKKFVFKFTTFEDLSEDFKNKYLMPQ